MRGARTAAACSTAAVVSWLAIAVWPAEAKNVQPCAGPELRLHERGVIGVRPGEPSRVTLTLRSYARRRIERARPRLLVWRPEGRRLVFPAQSTGHKGSYQARVVFPGPGRWRYAADDGLRGPPNAFHSGAYYFHFETIIFGRAVPAAGSSDRPRPKAAGSRLSLPDAALVSVIRSLSGAWQWWHRGS